MFTNVIDLEMKKKIQIQTLQYTFGNRKERTIIKIIIYNFIFVSNNSQKPLKIELFQKN